MEIYVEHHNWRRFRNNRKWSDNTVVKFTNLSKFENYIMKMLDKYPEYDVTYSIYECLGGPKGSLLAKLHYKNKEFNIVCMSNKWKSFCHQL